MSGRYEIIIIETTTNSKFNRHSWSESFPTENERADYLLDCVKQADLYNTGPHGFKCFLSFVMIDNPHSVERAPIASLDTDGNTLPNPTEFED